MEPFHFGMTLHRRRNRIEIVAGVSLGDSEFKTALRHVGKMPGFVRYLAAECGAGGIPVETLVIHAHVKTDNVPFLQDDVL